MKQKTIPCNNWGGPAGLTAARTAHELGAKVLSLWATPCNPIAETLLTRPPNQGGHVPIYSNIAKRWAKPRPHQMRHRT